MYQTNTALRIPNTFVLDRNRERKAVFYGRVSTEHEAQLAALEEGRKIGRRINWRYRRKIFARCFWPWQRISG